MSVSHRLVHVANSSNKNIRIGHWVFPSRKIICINGIADHLKDTFQQYINSGELYVTANFRDAIMYLKQVKPRINIDAILGRPPLPKDVRDAQEKKDKEISEKKSTDKVSVEKKTTEKVPENKSDAVIKKSVDKPAEKQEDRLNSTDTDVGAKPVEIVEEKATAGPTKLSEKDTSISDKRDRQDKYQKKIKKENQ